MTPITIKSLSFFLVTLMIHLTVPITCLAEETAWKTSEAKSQKIEDWELRSDRAERWLFSELPRHIGQDLKGAFFNKWHLIALGAGTLAIVGVHEADPNIQRSFQSNRPFGNTFDDVMKWGANPLVFAGANLATYGVAKAIKNEKLALVTGTVREALILNEVFTLGLKYSTRRERPDGGKYSFPSGHTSRAFTAASVMYVYYGPWVGVPSYMLASLVGVSRIDANRHVTTDVMAGALLGTLIGLGTAEFHKKEFENILITPVVSEGRAGLALAYLF